MRWIFISIATLGMAVLGHAQSFLLNRVVDTIRKTPGFVDTRNRFSITGSVDHLVRTTRRTGETTSIDNRELGVHYVNSFDADRTKISVVLNRSAMGSTFAKDLSAQSERTLGDIAFTRSGEAGELSITGRVSDELVEGTAFAMRGTFGFLQGDPTLKINVKEREAGLTWTRKLGRKHTLVIGAQRVIREGAIGLSSGSNELKLPLTAQGWKSTLGYRYATSDDGEAGVDIGFARMQAKDAISRERATAIGEVENTIRSGDLKLWYRKGTREKNWTYWLGTAYDHWTLSARVPNGDLLELRDAPAGSRASAAFETDHRRYEIGVSRTSPFKGGILNLKLAYMRTPTSVSGQAGVNQFLNGLTGSFLGDMRRYSLVMAEVGYVVTTDKLMYGFNLNQIVPFSTIKSGGGGGTGGGSSRSTGGTKLTLFFGFPLGR